MQAKFQMLLEENQNLATEKELKLIPRIEQLLRENAAYQNGTNIGEGQNDVEGLLVKNEYLQDQLNQHKAKLQGSY